MGCLGFVIITPSPISGFPFIRTRRNISLLDLTVQCRVLGKNPIIRTDIIYFPTGTLFIKYRPSKSVLALYFVSNNVTTAPGNGSLFVLLTTIPRILPYFIVSFDNVDVSRVCARAETPMNTAHSRDRHSSFFIAPLLRTNPCSLLFPREGTGMSTWFRPNPCPFPYGEGVRIYPSPTGRGAGERSRSLRQIQFPQLGRGPADHARRHEGHRAVEHQRGHQPQQLGRHAALEGADLV